MSEKQPTQAGKFKPRKPPKKKIAVPSEDSSKPFSGDSNDNVVAVESITQKVVSTRERRDGASFGGRGRGRDRGGGRGGRGGRCDVPKGTVFFTGDAAQVNSLKSGIAKSGNSVIERPVTNRTERPTNASSSSSGKITEVSICVFKKLCLSNMTVAFRRNITSWNKRKEGR